MEIERRAVSDGEMWAAEDGKIVGYAAVFDTESVDLGGFREVVRRTAFDRALREGHEVIARTHHEDAHVLGTTASGHVTLEVDERGLKYTVTPVNTNPARDTQELIRSGVIRHSSFAFRVPKGGDKWESRAADGTTPLRELIDVDLVDVAPVIGPAYKATVVSARSLEQAKGAEALPEPGVPNEINEARLRLASE